MRCTSSQSCITSAKKGHKLHMTIQLLDCVTAGGILVSGDWATPDTMEALRANAGISLASWASSSDLRRRRRLHSFNACGWDVKG